MIILSRRAKGRTKVSLLHGGSKIKATIEHPEDWELLRDRLDDAVAKALRRDAEENPLPVMPGDTPIIRLMFTCDLSHLQYEEEFEEAMATVHRVMHEQSSHDVQLVVLISPQLRKKFDSVEWMKRVACASRYHTSLVVHGTATSVDISETF